MVNTLELLTFSCCCCWLLCTVWSSPQLLFANRKDIRLIEAFKPRSNSTIVVSHLEDATALDFCYEDQTVFWADISLEMIKMTYKNSSGVQINVITTGLTSPEGLACDWLTKKLYWTDAETNRIEVSNFDGRYRKVLFWEELDQPRAIALAPMDGLMFWTDWGEMPKIERASMDGNLSSRVIIVNNNISWPNGVTVDYDTKRIYWADRKFHQINSVDYNGGNRRIVAQSNLEHPFALTVHRNIVYWTDWITGSINMCNQTSGVQKQLVSGQLSPLGIHVYDAERQPKKHTMCNVNNGGCSHLCLLTSVEPGYTCACPTGVRLKDQFNCFDGAQEMLLLARRTDLRRISLDTPDYTDVVLQVQGVKHAVAVDYDPVDNYLYWSDDEVRRIRRAYLDGRRQEDLIVTEVYHPDGVAVDWIARNLYWTDTGTDRIEVARLNGTSRRVLINQGLKEPRAIVVHPVAGYMFWTDWGQNAKIERAALDGTDRLVIVANELGWPNGLALDYETDKVYWGDGKIDRIEMCNLDGSDRRQLVSDQLPHIFGFSLLGNYVYWTDWQRRSIEQVHKIKGTERKTIIEQLPDLMGLKAIKVNHVWGTSPCANQNGGCSHLCLNRPNGTYVCSCPMGMELTSTRKTCIVPEAFLLFAKRNDICRISLKTQHNNMVIPVSGIKQVTALDFDIDDNRIYWMDVGQKTISRAFMNGSNSHAVIDFGLEYPEGMAVDWIARNIYWSDSSTNRIEVARLDGTSRKVLLWKDVTPRAISVDPNQGYLYWCDYSVNSFHIGRAALDGSERIVMIKDSGKATGLTVDFEDQKLFWVNIDTSIIESSDIQGKERTRVIMEPLRRPYGLTQYQDFIYWTDLELNTIERANKTSGENRTKIESQVAYATDILVFHGSRQSGWNPCFANNGGCSHLCFALPSDNNRSVYNHSCSCPTHYELSVDDNRTCIEPKVFMLMSTRNQINRLVLDGKDAPDIILPIQHLKHVRSIDYDFVERFIYWVDGRTNSIRRSYENGSSVSVVVPNPNAFTPYDIAVDVFSRRIYWSCEKTNVINVTGLDSSAIGAVVAESISGVEERPREIVLHPASGLMFWINMIKSPCIERAALDGEKRVKLFQTELEEPNALALDVLTDTLYWSDLKLQRIESAKIDGSNRRVLVHAEPFQPISLAVFGQHLYYLNQDVIMKVNKLNGSFAERILNRVNHLTDLVAINQSVYQPMARHPCFEKNGGCSHLCVAELDSNLQSSARCSCPMGLVLKDDDLTCGDPPTCSPDQFTCEKNSMQCIPIVWRCDGTPECDDKSDEMNCPNCGRNQFRCRNGDCVDHDYLCDKKVHCSDGSDEAHCCNQDEFMCSSNQECIKRTLVCNGKSDCSDGSDERYPPCAQHPRDTHPQQTRYTIGIVVAVVVIILVLAIIFICRLRSRQYGDSEECTDMMLAIKPLTSEPAPSYPSMLVHSTAPLLRSSGDGALTLDPLFMSSSMGGSTSGTNAPPPSFVGGYDRSILTATSSSSSCVTNYPRETLNPPPSPVTEESHYSSSYCYSSHVPLAPPPSYRHYRTRVIRPPPPTPCSTDVCDDSEPDPCHRRYYNNSYASHLCYKTDPCPPPPTPRSHYSDDICESCPPSPSTGRSFCKPYPPPPSPEG